MFNCRELGVIGCGESVLEAPLAWSQLKGLAMTKKTLSSRPDSEQVSFSRTWGKWGHIDWVELIGMAPVSRAVARKHVQDGEEHYAYILWRSDLPDHVPFYVGKGSGERVFQHFTLAKETSAHKHAIINKHKSLGIDYGYSIAGFFSDEVDALNLEKALIKKIGRADQGRGPLVNKCDGGNGPNGFDAPKRGDAVKARPVYAGGSRFACMIDAAEDAGITSGMLATRIKNGWPGYYYEDEGQKDFNTDARLHQKREVQTPIGLFSSLTEAAAAVGISPSSLNERIERGWESFYYTDEGQRFRRDGLSPCIIDGVRFESRIEASEKLGLGAQTVQSRLRSSNFTNYVDLGGGLEKQHKRKPNKTKIWVHGTEYQSTRQASQATGIDEESLRNRARSSNYPDVVIPGIEKEGRRERNFGAEIHIDGVVYYGFAEAARAIGENKSTIKLRIQSPSFPNYWSPAPHLAKKQPRHGRPSLVGIEIDGVRYRSILSAHKLTGMNRGTIADRLKSSKWPSYKRFEPGG